VRFRLNDLVRHYLSVKGDPRLVVTDPDALFFGLYLDERALLPGDSPRIGAVHFVDWLSQSPVTPAKGSPSRLVGVPA